MHKSNGATDGYTENYISKLRDDVSSQSGVFSKTALLIIHNSFLDTLINSAQDLGSDGNVWSVSSTGESLEKLINKKHEQKDVSFCLLEHQCDIIKHENATMFGFEPLYYALEDGELEFNELGLFDDPILLKMEGKRSQIKGRFGKKS